MEHQRMNITHLFFFMYNSISDLDYVMGGNLKIFFSKTKLKNNLVVYICDMKERGKFS